MGFDVASSKRACVVKYKGTLLFTKRDAKRRRLVNGRFPLCIRAYNVRVDAFFFTVSCPDDKLS